MSLSTDISFERTVLDNGMRIVTSTMPYTRAVSVSVYVGVGSRYESDEKAGISHVLEHLVFKGTERRPAPLDISGGIEGLGGVLNAGTEQELTVYWCKVAVTYLEESLDLLLDMVRNSVYDSDELERELMVVIEEQNMVNDQPSSKVEQLIDGLLWPDHPLGRDIGGTHESVSKMTRDMILEHAERYYFPGNIVVSVAGNVAHEHVVSVVSSLTNGWLSHTIPDWTKFDSEKYGPEIQIEYRKTEQSHLAIALPGLSIDHPDRYAADLLSVVLGEGMSSRLFVEVREKQGLAYEINSSNTYFMDCGALLIMAGVDPKNVQRAVSTILNEVSSLRYQLPEQELDKAKRMSTGIMALRMEDTRAVSAWMGTQELLLDRILEFEEVVNRVNQVTIDDINRVANDLLKTNHLKMAVVGPHRGSARLMQVLRL